MEAILVFVVTFIALLGVALAFALGKPPAYRPSREDIFKLLVDVQNNHVTVEAWEMFLSLPISHDPELEAIRRQCLVLVYGESEHQHCGSGINGELLDREGMQGIREITVQLKHLIDQQPASKWF